MTTPSKLDEARLRELAEAALSEEKTPKGAVAFRHFREAADPDAILALLDALSAERERADRAVEYIAKEIHAGRNFVGKREWAKGTNRKYYRRQAEKILAAPGREWKYG